MAPKQTVAERVIDASDSTLIDLLDRLLDKGVSANGDLTLGVAGVDLVYVRLSALLCAVDRVFPPAPAPKAQRRSSVASQKRRLRSRR